MRSTGLKGVLISKLKAYEGFLQSDLQMVSPVSGVPEDSWLGPSLFKFFMNDISDVIEFKILLFADDIKLYVVVKGQGGLHNPATIFR